MLARCGEIFDAFVWRMLWAGSAQLFQRCLQYHVTSCCVNVTPNCTPSFLMACFSSKPTVWVEINHFTHVVYMNTIKYFPTNISAQVVKLHNKCYHLKRKVIVAYSKMVFQFISRQSNSNATNSHKTKSVNSRLYSLLYRILWLLFLTSWDGIFHRNKLSAIPYIIINFIHMVSYCKRAILCIHLGITFLYSTERCLKEW